MKNILLKQQNFVIQKMKMNNNIIKKIINKIFNKKIIIYKMKIIIKIKKLKMKSIIKIKKC